MDNRTPSHVVTRPNRSRLIAGLASFLIPGLGQLYMSQFAWSIGFGTLTLLVYASGAWPVGLLVHAGAIVHAAVCEAA